MALTTLATLLLELSLTRIFSVVFYYHFAFLAISIALFGLGVGGVFSYVVAGWKTPLFRKLGYLSMLNSLLVIAALAVVVAQKEEPGAWGLTLVYFTTSLPFFVSGTIVSLAISETVERIDRVYFFDLLGASAGCLLLVPFLNYFGGTSTVMLVAVLFAAAGAIWHSMAGSVKLRAAAVALALALFAFVFYNGTHNVIAIRYAKGQKLKKEEFVAVEQLFAHRRAATTPSSSMRTLPPASPVSISRTSRHRERHELLEQGPALPYDIRPGAKALVIGPGGGWDVARALASGSHDITGVEINPIIATTIMRDRLRGAKPRHLPASGCAHLRGRWPQLRAPQPRALSGGAGHPGGYLGLHRGGRLRAFGEQPLYHRRLARLPAAPDRRRHGRLHALGIRSAARIPAAGFAGHGGSESAGRTGALAARHRGPGRLHARAGARRIPC